MKKLLSLNIGGIKCDNKSCDFADQSVTVDDYPNWVNKPCPRCGENLLTEADYENVLMLMTFTKIMNDNFEMKDNSPLVSMHIEMNGSGSMTITDMQVIEDDEREV